MGIPFTTKIIGSEENKMKKIASAGLSILVATGVAGIGGNEVQAAEQAQPKTPENVSSEQPAVKVTQTTEQAITEKQQQVTEKQAIVDQKQQVADTAKKEKDTIDQSVKDQQAVVDEAKKVVDEATPSAIEKAKDQVVTDTQAVDDQQKVVEQAQTYVNQQQAVVEEKAKETTAAKVQNDKDQQAVTAAKQEQAKLEELAKNAEAEKAKAEKEQAAKEAELANKQKEEAKAKDQKTKDDQAVADQQTVVTTSQEKVADAKADTDAKQADLTAKENALKDKQAMEKEALALNKVFPENQADAAKATEMIDIKNPTEKQKKQMSDYFVGLLNDVREKLGLQKLKVSSQNIKFAWDNAKYTNPNEIGHDENAINKAAKENGFKEYPGQNFYENLSGGYFQPKDGKISVLDFERAAREALVDMLFNDGRMGYGHTESLLQVDKTNTAIALSEENHGFSSGKIHIIGYNQDW